MDNMYGWTASASFECNKTDTVAIVSGYKVGTTKPSDVFGSDFSTYDRLSLKLFGLEISDSGKPGFDKVTATFGGADKQSEQAEENVSYSLSTSTNMAPLTEHPKWALMSEVNQDILGNAFSGQWRIEVTKDGVNVIVTNPTDGDRTYYTEADGDAFLFGKLIAKGKLTWPNPVLQWTETRRTGARISDKDIAKLGKIDKPSGYNQNKAPDVQNRDWYLKECEATRVHGVWSGSRVWESAGKDAALDELLFL